MTVRLEVDPSTMTWKFFLGSRGGELTEIPATPPNGQPVTPSGPTRLLVGIQHIDGVQSQDLDVYWDDIVVRALP